MTADTLTDTLASPVHAPAHPAHWRMARLGDVSLSFVSGGTPSTKSLDLWDGDVPWTTSAPIGADDVLLDQAQRFVTQAGLSASATNLVDAGNLLVGTRVGVGKAVVNEIDIAISQDLTGLVLDHSQADTFYLAYYFKTSQAQGYLDGRKRGTTIKGISRFDLQELPILLPPLAEQRAIARVLRAAQDAIAARRREVTLERERKAALMQRLFTHGVRGEPTKQTEIGEMPQSWQVVRLGDVASIERGKFSHRPRNDPEFYGGRVPFIQTGDVTAADGRITTYTQTLNEKGLAVSRVFPKGTIVITIAANIGYTGILELDSAFPDSLIGITARDDVGVQYLHYYLVTQQPEMDRRAPQGTQKNINIEFLSPWSVRLPPLAEQRAIADTLAACDAHIAALEREIALHEEMFRALLEELMSGRLSALPLAEEEALAVAE